MSEPKLFEELGRDQFLVHEPGTTEAQRIEHARLKYEQRMEKLKDEDLAQVKLALEGPMTERKREVLVRILDELQENIQQTDEQFEEIVSGGVANSRGWKELIDSLNLFRKTLLKKRIELAIAHATEHAPIIAHAALQRMK